MIGADFFNAVASELNFLNDMWSRVKDWNTQSKVKSDSSTAKNDKKKAKKYSSKTSPRY